MFKPRTGAVASPTTGSSHKELVGHCCVTIAALLVLAGAIFVLVLMIQSLFR